MTLWGGSYEYWGALGMKYYKRGLSLLARYRNDSGGNIAISFAVGAIAMMGCMGAAMDFSTLSNAKSRSQSIADQTVLAAAIFVKTNGREPNPPVPVAEGETPNEEEGYLDSSYRVYTAEDLGYEFKGWVDGGASNVNVEVIYDGTAKEARVKVTGNTMPTFLQVFGHHNLEFEAEATAKYEEYDFYDPASIIMVLDNSGSMAFDDKKLVLAENSNDWEDQDDVLPRIEALQNHASNFMTTLKSLVGDQSSNDDKVLRTGMLAYNTDTINGRTVSMNWGTDNVKTSIGRMAADGGTNSAPPIDTAREWFENEDTEHTNIHGKDPLKFMVFMTDGINTSGGSTWVDEDETGQWRGLVCQRYNRRGTCRYYDYDTVEQETEPTYGYGWEEGSWQPTGNIQSVSDCTAMKNDGVKIYSIGFALAEGYYDTNRYFGYETNTYIDTDVRDQAYAFLAECASDADTFLTAENAEQLEDAFTRIGNDIQTEIIRLSN